MLKIFDIFKKNIENLGYYIQSLYNLNLIYFFFFKKEIIKKSCLLHQQMQMDGPHVNLLHNLLIKATFFSFLSWKKKKNFAFSWHLYKKLNRESCVWRLVERKKKLCFFVRDPTPSNFLLPILHFSSLSWLLHTKFISARNI